MINKIILIVAGVLLGVTLYFAPWQNTIPEETSTTSSTRYSYSSGEPQKDSTTYTTHGGTPPGTRTLYAPVCTPPEQAAGGIRLMVEVLAAEWAVVAAWAFLLIQVFTKKPVDRPERGLTERARPTTV
ncbi:MAG: hypothetical protein JWR26_279 [Pedosphaera sp.]|nr:hypothetical protein [Pedosphaera sp.]